MASESLKSDPLRPPPPAPSEFYGVTVYDHVGDIVTIEPQMLAGRDIGECEAKAIYAAIESLRGFVGAKRNDLTALQASQRPAGQGWQPITDAPKDGIPFIAANIFDAFRAFYDAEKEVWIAEDSGLWFGCMKYPPTHFMPLPPQEKPDAN